MNDENIKSKTPRYIPFKCVNCNGYGSISYGKIPCRVCKEKGYIVIDQTTGLQVDNDDDYEKQNSED